jgi:hypothetical protein
MQQRLSVWLAPQRFDLRTRASIRLLPRFALFLDPRASFLREAHLAGIVAEKLQATHVRLGADPPDFELRYPSLRVRRFECVEADQQGRRRGDEYRYLLQNHGAGPYPLQEDPETAWRARAAGAPCLIRRVSDAKARRNYPQGTELVIYLNLMTYGAYSSLVLPFIHEATCAAGQKFKSVNVLWQDTLFVVWNEGRAEVLSKPAGWSEWD